MDIALIDQKQKLAINALVNSESNIFNLAYEGIKDICYSSAPKIYGASIKWASDSHEKLWRELEKKSTEEIIADFAIQIQNDRVIKDVIGEEAWYAQR